ncbi:MAG TPA: pirin-like C-terminal cupin domain-containing protein, partial [Aequorivita sp.]|nr:pirin-like C-terminal cupin domain-containing protein [Aequorivita sp.]
GNFYEPKQLLVAKDSTLCQFTIAENSTIYIFGGEPFPEKRYIDWNFVSSRKERIEEAKQKWMNKEFPKIKGEEDAYIPYPTMKRK